MKEYEITELDKARWKGFPLPLSYTSEEYYDIAVIRTAEGFEIPISKKRFDKPFTSRPEDHDFPDKLFADWWEDARAFGVVEDGRLLAVMEVCPEEWSKRLLVTELLVGKELRGSGYGKKLIDLAKKLTIEGGYRALMLETQSNNVNAVDFYLHEGFTLIGFDSCCYANDDLERKEVRFNMGWFPEKARERSAGQGRRANTDKEEKTMQAHRIVRKEQFTVVGIKRRFDSDTSYREIPKFWDELMEKGEDRPIMGTFGLCLDMEGKRFDYWIADLYFPWEEIPEGCETKVIPAGLWAEFPCTIGTLQETNTKIWSEWLPALKGYALAGEYDAEVYLPPKKGSGEMTVAIWIPLNKID